MSELLPCPFCGNQSICSDGRKGWYEITCPNCGVEMGDVSEAEAVAAWNRRAPAIPPDVSEAIRKIADYGMPLGATNYDWRGWRDTALTCLDAQEDRP